MIKFQQKSGAPDFKRPWQVIVDDDGQVIYGRPDAAYLVGFGPVGEMTVTVVWTAAMKDPSLAVGLAPTFQQGGSMFGVDLPVVECSVWEADETTKALLRERETQMRKAFEAIDEMEAEHPECEHEWMLNEDGYSRSWTTEITEDGTIRASFNGTEDWTENGDGHMYLLCTGCMARKPVEDGTEIVYL